MNQPIGWVKSKSTGVIVGWLLIATTLSILGNCKYPKPQVKAEVPLLQEKARVVAEKTRRVATLCLTTEGESEEYNKTVRKSGTTTAESAERLQTIADREDSFKPEKLSDLSTIYNEHLRAEWTHLADTRKYPLDPRVYPRTAAQVDAIHLAHVELRDALEEIIRLLPPAKKPSEFSTDESNPSRYTLKYNECVRQRTEFGVSTAPCAEWAKE